MKNQTFLSFIQIISKNYLIHIHKNIWLGGDIIPTPLFVRIRVVVAKTSLDLLILLDFMMLMVPKKRAYYKWSFY